MKGIINTNTSPKTQIETLRRDIKVGLDQLDRGQKAAFDKELVEKIKVSGRKRLNLKK